MKLFLIYRRASAREIDTIIAGLRASDRAEIAALGLDPAAAVRKSVEASVFWRAGFGRSGAQVLFGVGSAEFGRAVMWMVGTEELNRDRRTLLADSRWWLPRLAEAAGVVELVNTVHRSSVGTLRYLDKIGCRLERIGKSDFIKITYCQGVKHVRG